MDIFIGCIHWTYSLNAVPSSGNDDTPGSVRRGGGAGALFRFQDGRQLTRECFIICVMVALLQFGVEACKHAGHSIDSGATSIAVHQSTPDPSIKLGGRTVPIFYMRKPQEINWQHCELHWLSDACGLGLYWQP